MIKAKKINEIQVKPVIVNGAEPHHSKIKGYDYVPGLFANIFICAKKKSGKTNVIFNLLKHITTTKSKVYLFSSTISKDSTYDAIQAMLDKRKVEFEAYTHFIDDESQENILKDILNEKDNESKDLEVEDDSDVRPPRTSTIQHGPLFGPKPEPEQTDEEKAKAKKPSKEAPELVFVFDDLGSDLRSPSINQLLKTNRHHKAKVILSSQYITDLQPQAIKQLDFALLFKSFNDEKLHNIHSLLDLSNSFDDFKALYKYATQEPFSFLYVDVRSEIFRKGFSIQIKLDEESQEGGGKRRRLFRNR